MEQLTFLAGYWITQAGAILFPGSALHEPEFAPPGQPPAQLIVDLVMLVMPATGYFPEANQLTRHAADK